MEDLAQPDHAGFDPTERPLLQTARVEWYTLVGDEGYLHAATVDAGLLDPLEKKDSLTA